jgi:hypothetical protein
VHAAPGARRRVAPLMLLAAGVGAAVAIGPKLPHDHEVGLDFGSAAATITDVELAWTPNGATTDEASLSTRWHFNQGTAPSRLSTKVRLPDGAWTAEVEVHRAGTNETTHWSGRVNLEGSPFWKGADSRDAPVILSVRQALR